MCSLSLWKGHRNFECFLCQGQILTLWYLARECIVSVLFAGFSQEYLMWGPKDICCYCFFPPFSSFFILQFLIFLLYNFFFFIYIFSTDFRKCKDLVLSSVSSKGPRILFCEKRVLSSLVLFFNRYFFGKRGWHIFEIGWINFYFYVTKIILVYKLVL